MTWTAPRTWVAGEVVTAALLNTHVRDNLKAIGDPWTSYVPTLTNISLGSGTRAGAYMQAGGLVFGRARFQAGGTTTYPGGNLSVGLPVAAAASYSSGDTIGFGSLNNGSGSARRLVSVFPTPSSTVMIMGYE